MKKRTLFVLASASLAISLASCGGGSSPSSTVTSSESASSATSSSTAPSSSEQSTESSSSSSSRSKAETYTLAINIVMEGAPATFGNIQFIHNFTGSTTEYIWGHEISKEAKTRYTYEMKGLDTSKTLYFGLYIWDTGDLGNCYIKDFGGNNFNLTPYGVAKEEITITFQYPTHSGDSVGILDHNIVILPTSMTFADQTTKVYGEPIRIEPTFDHGSDSFVATYEGDDIRIDRNLFIVGLRAGTTTKVTLTTENGLTCDFNVTVATSKYKATAARDTKWATSEKWFSEPSVDPIAGLGQDFMNGMDISSMKALYDNGAKFFGEDGVERALPYILKEHGVNWARLKLWVDPTTSKGTSYGGGASDLANTLWMAKECKEAGLKFLLDFHYSDYWTHPAQQIVPKAWANATSAEDLANKIRQYTKETLVAFKDYGCLPEMVQLGNEISSGSFLDTPGADSETFSDGVPSYVKNRGAGSFAYKAPAGSENMVRYLNAASQGVNDVDPSIKKVVHWAKGSSITAKRINDFFGALSEVDYDYAGLSLYPYYCFPTGTDALNEILGGLTLDKPWFVAETSYPFSGSSWVYEGGAELTSFTISDWTEEKDAKGITTMKALYPFTPVGQANLIHDMTSSVLANNGLGIFYWEPAWIPNKNVGWAGPGSKCSWSNQGFFSYDGKMIGNLKIFEKLLPQE